MDLELSDTRSNPENASLTPWNPSHYSRGFFSVRSVNRLRDAVESVRFLVKNRVDRFSKVKNLEGLILNLHGETIEISLPKSFDKT